jgi:hypothetical protein
MYLNFDHLCRPESPGYALGLLGMWLVLWDILFALRATSRGQVGMVCNDMGFGKPNLTFHTGFARTELILHTRLRAHLALLLVWDTGSTLIDSEHGDLLWTGYTARKY